MKHLARLIGRTEWALSLLVWLNPSRPRIVHEGVVVATEDEVEALCRITKPPEMAQAVTKLLNRQRKTGDESYAISIR